MPKSRNQGFDWFVRACNNSRHVFNLTHSGGTPHTAAVDIKRDFNLDKVKKLSLTVSLKALLVCEGGSLNHALVDSARLVLRHDRETKYEKAKRLVTNV